jgi:metallophosphoesterase superfamily enzyme
MVVPSFNPLLEGTDVLKEKILSPFLKEINNFDIYVVGDEGENFYFGKVRELK